MHDLVRSYIVYMIQNNNLIDKTKPLAALAYFALACFDEVAFSQLEKNVITS